MQHRNYEWHDMANPNCRYTTSIGVASPESDWCSCPPPESRYEELLDRPRRRMEVVIRPAPPASPERFSGLMLVAACVTGLVLGVGVDLFYTFVL